MSRGVLPPREVWTPADLPPVAERILVEDVGILLHSLPSGIPYNRLAKALVVLAGALLIFDGSSPQAGEVTAHNLRAYSEKFAEALRNLRSGVRPSTSEGGDEKSNVDFQSSSDV